MGDVDPTTLFSSMFGGGGGMGGFTTGGPFGYGGGGHTFSYSSVPGEYTFTF